LALITHKTPPAKDLFFNYFKMVRKDLCARA
jgi:hypothetical protein